jgi:hypothetical protein
LVRARHNGGEARTRAIDEELLMTFGLLLQHLPHIQESRANYDAMLSVRPAHLYHAHHLADWWRGLRKFVS